MIKDDWLRVGVISSPHGIKGEVKVYVTTDEPEMFEEWETLHLVSKKETKLVHIERVGFFKQMAILGFREVGDRNTAETLRGAELYIERSQASPCGENENYIADLIGMEVVLEDGSPFGTCTDVLQTGANDVYEVLHVSGKKVYLPAIPSCILKADTEENRMTVHILDGLL